MSKYSIDDCCRVACKKNGMCLSHEFKSVLDKLTWQCSKGHVWEQRLHNINRGGWCPYCANEKRGLARSNTIQDMQALALLNNGRCLADTYVGSFCPLLWECEEGHQWEATPNAVKGSQNRKGTWCPVCNGNPCITLDNLNEIARQRDGKCLSLKYKNARTKYQWQCKNGHIFFACWDTVQRGCWCPKCAGRGRSLKEIQEIAATKGGVCLSSRFERTTDKLKWKCSSGHVWKASLASILGGSWCPACKNYYTEEKCRFIFEALTGHQLPKTRVRVFGEDLFARYMELDGYCHELSMAFEHHGLQHYQRVRRFQKNPEDFELQKLKDKRKCQICKEKNIGLVIIPCQISCMGDRAIIDLIKKNVPHLIKNTRVDFAKFKIRSSLEMLKEVAHRQDGKCLAASYCGPHTKIEWECSLGHRWLASAASVKNNGSWCPKCARTKSGLARRKYSLEYFQKLALNRGGRCLSLFYSTTTDKIQWECKNGHRWESVAMSVIRGHWCRKCSYELPKLKD